MHGESFNRFFFEKILIRLVNCLEHSLGDEANFAVRPRAAVRMHDQHGLAILELNLKFNVYSNFRKIRTISITCFGSITSAIPMAFHLHSGQSTVYEEFIIDHE